MALMNRRLEPHLETIFLTPQEDYTFLSSRIVKEVGRLGGDVTPFVPTTVVLRLQSKFSSGPSDDNSSAGQSLG
jgi:pantetheine-phosphate adenylyltransferase